jgi:sulfur carrier protein
MLRHEAMRDRDRKGPERKKGWTVAASNFHLNITEKVTLKPSIRSQAIWRTFFGAPPYQQKPAVQPPRGLVNGLQQSGCPIFFHLNYSIGMTLFINGEEKSFADSLSLTQLVELLGMKGDRVAVELNREIVPRAQWTETYLKDGDHLEIVHFVGGG